jgi:hypothetical protein
MYGNFNKDRGRIPGTVSASNMGERGVDMAYA